ncbi:MAG TPA: glycoside hydrolase family 71/99-like protein [Fimbriimonas sp.]
MLLTLLLATETSPPKPLLLAHYMPWYESRPVSGHWGWHWTMGKLDPDRGEAASHYRPLMGLYDSGDLQTINCHLSLMKLAGIDGIFVDWYGDVDHYDYGIIHRNTQKLFHATRRMGMKFALVYEDQTVPQLIRGGKFAESDAVAQGKRLFGWVERNWFRSAHYLKQGGKPVLLVFGPQYYQPEQWRAMLPQTAFYTLHYRREPALGAYDWPYPREAGSREAFRKRAQTMPAFIPVAFPRFHDYYAQAGVHESWGHIGDDGGKTYERTLKESLSASMPFVQIATWNDWGEGTQIEPSKEFGYRDLETTQRLTKSRFRPADLRLPIRLFALQKKHYGKAKVQERLAAIGSLLNSGRTSEAERRVDKAEAELRAR